MNEIFEVLKTQDRCDILYELFYLLKIIVQNCRLDDLIFMIYTHSLFVHLRNSCEIILKKGHKDCQLEHLALIDAIWAKIE
jgi:hypothetical protein